MPDSFNQNPWQEDKSAAARAPEIPKVAAPPVEVAIRTMASDIASMAQSGGGPPKPESVTLPFFREEENEGQSFTASREKVLPAKKGSVSGGPAFRYVILAASIVAGSAAIFFGSYYGLYPLLGRLKSSAPKATSTTTSTAPSAKAPSRFEHHSFFKQAVDGTFILKISSSRAGFQASSQQRGQFLTGLASSSTFFEIQPQSSSDQPLSANEFFSSINGGVLEQSFLASAFNPDFTVFLYKDKNGLSPAEAGLWPGYILQLKTNKTPLLLQPDVAKIESASSNWEDLFLQPPGSPIAMFRDVLVSGQPVRILNFSDTKSVLVYGWFLNKYLIISTSLDGMKQAIQHF